MTPRRPRARLTVAVCGFGSIGRRHAANAARLGARVVVLARSPRKAAPLCRGLGYQLAASETAAFSLADAVVIATPTSDHMPVAIRAARARKAIFLEKPVAESFKRVAEFVAASRGLVVEVGCQLRAHPALRLLKKRMESGRDGPQLAFRGCVGQRLDQWRPGTDYRNSYSADARRGGGALLDLIHEVDLVSWLCGPVTHVAARLSRLSDLQMRAEDLANILLECRGGACGSLQLDMLSPAYRRSFELVCARATYEWDYDAGLLLRRSSRAAKVLWRAPRGFERNQLFLDHMRHFLARTGDRRLAPLCSLSDGVTALNIAIAAKRAARTRRWQAVGRAAA